MKVPVFVKVFCTVIGAQLRRLHHPFIVFGGVTTLLLAPLFASGFILTLDMVMTPRIALPEEVGPSYPLYAVLHVLSVVVPGDIVQKLLLAGIFLLAGWGMYKLVGDLQAGDRSPAWQWAAYASGIFYMVNPFVYGRFMAGQHAVLLGYALLPFFCWALLRFLRTPNIKTALYVAAWTIAISIVSIHTIGLVAAVTLIALVIFVWRRRAQPKKIRAVALWLAGVAGLVLVASSYWLLPAMHGEGSVGTARNFSETDRQAFATDGGFIRVLGLQGFWAESQGLFTMPQEVVPLWGLARLALWAVVGIGFVVAWRRHRPVGLGLIAVSVVAIIVSLGTTAPGIGWLNQLLVDYVPFFSGYREPHKFAGLLALTYSCSLAYMVWWLYGKLSSSSVRVAALIALCGFAFVYTPTLLWGAYGQLTPRQYPKEWYAANEQLNKEVPPGSRVLFLPWHLYMPFAFTERVIANPADMFFDTDVVISNDPEFAGVKPQSPSSLKDKMGKDILPQAPKRQDFAARLRAQGITYVLLAKEADYKVYDYIYDQPGMQAITNNDALTIFKVGHE